jgi:hypothetical protein
MHDAIEKAPKIVVYGAGLVGIEMAGEILDRYAGKKSVLLVKAKNHTLGGGAGMIKAQEEQVRKMMKSSPNFRYVIFLLFFTGGLATLLRYPTHKVNTRTSLCSFEMSIDRVYRTVINATTLKIGRVCVCDSIGFASLEVGPHPRSDLESSDRT